MAAGALTLCAPLMGQERSWPINGAWRFGPKTALVTPARRLSFHELNDASDAVACGLGRRTPREPSFPNALDDARAQRARYLVTALPAPHVYGNVAINATLLAGGTVVLMSRFNAAALELIAEHGATLFEGVPTM